MIDKAVIAEPDFEALKAMTLEEVMESIRRSEAKPLPDASASGESSVRSREDQAGGGEC